MMKELQLQAQLSSQGFVPPGESAPAFGPATMPALALRLGPWICASYVAIGFILLIYAFFQ